MQLIVYSVSACWRSELGQDTPTKYLALDGKSVIIVTFVGKLWLIP